jgi:hypothetical protein
MAELPLYPVREIDLGDWILRLDGTVLELFRRGVDDGAIRLHLKHLAVEAKPRDDGLRLTVGQEIGGLVIGTKLDVPAEQRDEVMAFFAESRRRRDSYSNLG